MRRFLNLCEPDVAENETWEFWLYFIYSFVLCNVAWGFRFYTQWFVGVFTWHFFYQGGWSKTDKLLRPFRLLLQTSTKWWQLIAVMKDFWREHDTSWKRNIQKTFKKTRTSGIALRLFHPFLVPRSNYHFVNSQCFRIYEYLLMSWKVHMSEFKEFFAFLKQKNMIGIYI